MSSVAFDANPFLRQVADAWWVPVARGIAAVAFGVMCLVAPGISLVALSILFGVYALADGVFAWLTAFMWARTGQRWGWLAFNGVLSVIAGTVAFMWPAITAVFLLMVIAAWAVLTGIAEVATAVALRKYLAREWLLAAGGALSIAFGVLIMLRPEVGVLAVMWAVGLYALVFGGLLFAVGLRLHALKRSGTRIGGIPHAA